MLLANELVLNSTDNHKRRLHHLCFRPGTGRPVGEPTCLHYIGTFGGKKEPRGEPAVQMQAELE